MRCVVVLFVTSHMRQRYKLSVLDTFGHRFCDDFSVFQELKRAQIRLLKVCLLLLYPLAPLCDALACLGFFLLNLGK